MDAIATTAINALDTAAEIWHMMAVGFDAEATWIVGVLVLAAVFMAAVQLGIRKS